MTIETQSQRGEHSPLRRIIGSVFAILQTRLELVGIELAEEKDRLLGVLFLGLAAMMLATMALIALTALIAIAFWDTYRWQALAGITAVYAIAGIGLCAESAQWLAQCTDGVRSHHCRVRERPRRVSQTLKRKTQRAFDALLSPRL